MADSPGTQRPPLIKVVYFDEQSASDYLDISSGGSESVTSEQVTARVTSMQANFEGKLAARFSWVPFLGASASTGAGASVGRDTQSLLSKTLSNTILTDYLTAIKGDDRVVRHPDLHVSALPGSMAYLKLFTPYLLIAGKTEDGVDLARMDDAFIGAKGYYEMVGAQDDGNVVCILRFNVHAFRNSYGLIDLARMRLTYYAVSVGLSTLPALSFESEMKFETQAPTDTTVQDAFDTDPLNNEVVYAVFDVVLAGMESG
jgi:hypothetical protein